MKQKAYQVVFPVTLVVVIMAFLSLTFLADADFSFAAAKHKKSSAVTSAVAYTEAQIKQLQGALNITDAQKELWNNLTQVMRENAKDMDALTRERAKNTRAMNSVERLKFHSQIAEAHLNQLKKFIPPFEAFYNSLSDQQKNITDIIFRTGKYGKHNRK
jgi:hypothetical protein